MWRRPHWATDYVAGEIWQIVTRRNFSWRFLVDPEGLAGSPEQELMFRWFNAVIDMLVAGQNPASSPPVITRTEFVASFRAYMVDEARALEASRNYSVVAGLTRSFAVGEQLKAKLGQENADNIGDICRLITSCIHVLVGTEERLLVGVRDGRPAWQTVDRTLTVKDVPMFVAKPHIALFGLMQYVDQGAVGLIPQYGEFDIASMNGAFGNEYADANARLVEAAFLGQRYTLDPGGVYVKVTGAGRIIGVQLQARSTGANALMDVLARLETPDGAYFTVVSEDKLLHVDTQSTPTFPTMGSAAAYVVCQVYHDLVTAVDIEAAGRRQPVGPLGVGRAPGIGTTMSWTVIPRRVRRRRGEGPFQPIRNEVPDAVISEPRRVGGHRRRGNMTPGHREALRQFELEYGVEILRFVPDGETYVRPHFNPHATPDEIRTLPRYIRYRIQKELEASLRRGLGE